VVAVSTAEAEYIAAAAAVKEGLWFRKLQEDLQIGKQGAGVGSKGAAAAAVQLLTGNQAALALLGNNSSNSVRAKHIDVVYHFARERVLRGEVAFNYCPTHEMLADALTKPLTAGAFVKLRGMMGMANKSG
jgi:hypothetical protein